VTACSQDAHVGSFVFDEQYNTFHTFGYSVEPSGHGCVGDADALQSHKGTLSRRLGLAPWADVPACSGETVFEQRAADRKRKVTMLLAGAAAEEGADRVSLRRRVLPRLARLTPIFRAGHLGGAAAAR